MRMLSLAAFTAVALCGATFAITSATAQTPPAPGCGVETYSVADQKYVGVPCTPKSRQPDRRRRLRRRDLFGGRAEVRRRALHGAGAANREWPAGVLRRRDLLGGGAEVRRRALRTSVAPDLRKDRAPRAIAAPELFWLGRSPGKSCCSGAHPRDVPGSGPALARRRPALCPYRRRCTGPNQRGLGSGHIDRKCIKGELHCRRVFILPGEIYSRM